MIPLMANILSNPSTPETSDSGPDGLAESRNEFIAHWGEMGSSWGVPRSMAEIHALLYIEGRPLCVEEIMGRLEVSRGTASTTLRTLADWGLVSRVRPRGERREFFEAEQDVWKLLSLIVRARKRRELEPLLAGLDKARELAGADADPSSEAYKNHAARLDSMNDALKRLDRLSDLFIGRNGKGLDVAVKLLSTISGMRKS